MTFFEDDRPRKRINAEPGESLYDLSVEDLQARIEIYRAEIARLEQELEAKQKHRVAADSFFRR